MSEAFEIFGRDPLDALVDEMRKADCWPTPYDDAKDREFAEILTRRHPRLDLIREIEKWRVWMMDQPRKVKERPRARLQTWCERADQSRGGRAGSPAAAQRRTRPRTAAEFGDTSQTVSGW